MKLPVISNREFRGETVVLDNCRYENCRFIECTLMYNGGPSECDSCTIYPDTIWGFGAAAGEIMSTLKRWGWSIEYGKSDPTLPPAQFQTKV